MTRREILKLLAAYGFVSLTPLEATALGGKRVVIVGAGTAGLLCLSLLKKLSSSLSITVIAPNQHHIYQAGQTFMAAGLMNEKEMTQPTKKFLAGTHWVKQGVKNFEPEKSTVVCEDGQRVGYDYLIVATGLRYNYEGIKGLSEKVLGSKGIASVYLNNLREGSVKGGHDTKVWFEKIRQAASKQKVKVLFCNPHGAIKCGGVSSSIIYLLMDYLKGNSPSQGDDVTSNVEVIFTKPGTRIFGVDEYNKVLVETSKAYGVKTKFNHVIHSIDIHRKVAYFEHTYQAKGAYDEDFDEYEMITKKDEVQMAYDFIHIVPPMQAVKALSRSTLAKQSGLQVGYCEVDSKSLQHKRYNNVFALGDCAAVPLGKTAAAAKYQAKVLINNLMAQMKEGVKASFDGYSACPIKLGYQKVLFAEFDYEGYTHKEIENPQEPRESLFKYDLQTLPKLYWQTLQG